MNSTTKEVCIRKFGLSPPKDWSDDCDAELSLMIELWNNLVNIEYENRSAIKDLIYRNEDLKEINCKIDTYHARLSDEHIPDTVTAHKYIIELQRKRTILIKQATKEYAAEVRQIEYDRREKVIFARQSSKLWWGNYNSIIKSYEQSRNAASRVNGSINFREFDGSGRITNQIQGGASIEVFFDGRHSQVKVGRVSRDAWSHPVRGERRRLQRTWLTVTIFVKDGFRRTVTWPMVMHREIPEGFLIKEVVVTRKKLGLEWKWQVIFLCTRIISSIASSNDKSERVCAIDIGWRRVSEGVRIATTVSKEGELNFYYLPEILLDSFRFLDELRTRRKKMLFDITSYIKNLDVSESPDEVRSQILLINNLPRDNAREIFNLVLIWHKHISFEPECFGKILQWTRDDKKSYIWQVNHRRRIMGRRIDLYHNIARKIISNSTTVIINKIEVALLIKKFYAKRVEGGFPIRAHWYRSVVAPSELRRIIEHQCKKSEVLIKYSNKNFNVSCPTCGSDKRTSRPEDIKVACLHCGSTWDPDVNTCKSMLLHDG